jgi:hypothetical protein
MLSSICFSRARLPIGAASNPRTNQRTGLPITRLMSCRAMTRGSSLRRDMINLARKLAFVIKGQAEAKLLDTYSDDRIPVIRDVLTNTEGLTDTIGSENRLFRSVFSHIAPWVVGTEFMQENATERLSQLSLNYRSSPLSVSYVHAGELKRETESLTSSS